MHIFIYATENDKVRINIILKTDIQIYKHSNKCSIKNTENSVLVKDTFSFKCFYNSQKIGFWDLCR